MQTFLPYPDFKQSAQVLDRQRLGKQRVEVLQLLKALRDGGAWSHHPAARMWRGYEAALAVYGLDVCDEWISRGYQDTCRGKLADYFRVIPFNPPGWLGDEAFHAAHRSNLLRKNPDWYGQFGWTESADLPYVWPDGVK